MRKDNKRLLSVLALLLAFGQLPGVEASMQTVAAPSATNDKLAAQQPQAPTVIEADQVYFNDTSGDLFARGNVKITHNQDTILSDYIRGNQKQTTIWVDGNATLLQSDTKLTGSGLVYNYTAKTGSVQQAKGIITKLDSSEDAITPGKTKLKQEFLTGQKVELSPGYLVAQDATYTGCELETPDYRISADKVEVWPGDKMIAYNAKFWIKNTVVFTMPRYERSLKEQDSDNRVFPSVGYSNDNGVYIHQKFSYPLKPNLQVYTDLAYYSKAGFRPTYGVKWDKSQYYLQVESGDYYDGDVWVEKRPEYKFGIPKRHIGKLPVSYQFTAAYGKWTEDDKTSWHQDYSIYFSGDPIMLDSAKTLKLSLGTGVSHTRESYNDSSDTNWRYDMTLGKQWSSKLYTFVGQHYTEKKSDPVFTYDEPDVYNELASGIAYKINDRSTLSYKQSYDLDNDSLYSRTYGWRYSMHCWLLDFSHTNYTNDRHDRWRVKFDTNF